MIRPLLAAAALALAPLATAGEEPAPVTAADPAATPADRLAAANALLAGGDAAGAARAYEALAAEGQESAALHVNLGAARLREGRPGAAVASWLRALRLDPADEDARANLALLRARDRVAAAPERPFLSRVVERTPDLAAALLFLGPWTLLFLLLAGRLAARRPGTRALLSAGAALSAAAALAGAALVLGRDAERRTPTAVVVAAGAGLRDGPEEALRPARAVREGTVVRLLAAQGGAARVRLPDGAEGFLLSRDLELL